MKRWSIRIALFFGLLLIVFVLFFLWASSGTRSEAELATLTTYDAPPAAPRDTFAVMTYNIGYLSGMTNNEPVDPPRSFFEENLAAAAQLIRRADPDVIGFQEIDFGADRSFYLNQLDALAERLGYAMSATAINWDERYVPYPYGLPSVHFGRMLSGQAVLSRYPIRAHERIELQRTSRSFLTDRLYLDRLAQVVLIDMGRTVALINVHLEAFEEATREAQADEVRRLVQRYAEDYPVLLIGDFNAPTPAGRTVLPPEQQRRFADDETTARMLRGTALRAALPDSAYQRPAREVGTYPANAPDRKIDHLFYMPDAFEALDTQIRCGPPETPPSDHCAVVTRFVLRDGQARPAGATSDGSTSD